MPQCQFLFSAVFVFQKSCTGNILGIARDKNPGPYFSVTKPEPEEGKQRSRGVARQPPGAARPGPAPALCLGPPGRLRLRLFAHIFSASGKPLGGKEEIHEKFRRHRQRETHLGRVLKLFPAPCRRKKSSPEASTSPCLPPRRCVSSPPRDYGSIAVARW